MSHAPLTPVSLVSLTPMSLVPLTPVSLCPHPRPDVDRRHGLRSSLSWRCSKNRLPSPSLCDTDTQAWLCLIVSNFVVAIKEKKKKSNLKHVKVQ